MEFFQTIKFLLFLDGFFNLHDPFRHMYIPVHTDLLHVNIRSIRFKYTYIYSHVDLRACRHWTTVTIGQPLAVDTVIKHTQYRYHSTATVNGCLYIHITMGMYYKLPHILLWRCNYIGLSHRLRALNRVQLVVSSTTTRVQWVTFQRD